LLTPLILLHVEVILFFLNWLKFLPVDLSAHLFVENWWLLLNWVLSLPASFWIPLGQQVLSEQFHLSFTAPL